MYHLEFNNIKVCEKDISDYYYNLIRKNKIVAMDIETSGLDWHKESIGTCQLFTPNEQVEIINISKIRPKNICLILENKNIIKLFHHAMFDLRFMSYHWNVEPKNIICTKISAKLLDKTNNNEYHLKNLLKKYLGVVIDKNQTNSNWFANKLTKEQIKYASNDVYYLLSLFNILKRELISKHLWTIAEACFNHIPTRVKLDILGYNDIYLY